MSPAPIRPGYLAGLLVVACSLAAATAVADQADSRSLQASRATRPPIIDGDLSDPGWAASPASGDFTQRFPRAGRPASFRTEIRLLYDDQALYVAAHCFDPRPDGIVARVTRRDRWIESDWFSVYIDSRHDRQTATFFSVNAAGVKQDGTVFDEMAMATEWDGVWQAASRVVADGWIAELRIPLKLLRFQAGRQISFGINFERWISRLNESDYWQYIPPESGLWVSRLGELTGLDLKTRPIQLEVVPYAAARLDLAGARASGNRPLEAGADGRVGLGSNFMLTLTANPDFGQVEVDQVVLNLSTVETYFPEKRPFFLEDRNLFQTPGIGGPGQAELFYTRRIGRQARVPDTEDDEQIVRPARLPRIWGAAKLAGQTSGRLSVGLLQAVTSAEGVLVQRPDGSLAARVAEPLTSSSVLRLKQDFLHHSSAGLLLTALATPGDGTSLTAGSDLQLELFQDAYKLSLLTFFSYLTEERIAWQDSFTAAALREHGAFGYGGRLRFEKSAGEHLVGSINALYLSPNLALNDLGYLDRADRFMLSATLAHHRKKPLGSLARYTIQATGWIDRTSDWVNLGDGFEIDAYADFINGWYAGAWFFCGWPLCDDRETRSEGRVSFCGRAMRYRAGAWGQTSDKHAVSVGFDASFNTTERGGAGWIQLPLRFNPHPRLQLDLTPGYQISKGGLRWIETLEDPHGDRYLFADRHTEYWDVILRATLTFSTDLSLQAFAQVFLASVDHTRKFASRPTGTAIQVGDLSPAPEVADDHDFTTTSLQLNAILRWEYLPGSVLFFVYTGAFGEFRERPEFRFGRVLDDLLRADARHVLLLKMSFLFG